MKMMFYPGQKVCRKGQQKGEVFTIVGWENEKTAQVLNASGAQIPLHEDQIEVWEGNEPFWR